MVRSVMMMALTLAVAACSNTVAGLQHAAPPAFATAGAKPVVGAVAATDQRKEEAHRLATIMGGFGNPLKTLDTAKPVKDEVADAFTAGLRTRGLLAAGGQAPFRLALTVRRFDADMYMGRGARIDVTLSVVDQAGATVYEDTAVDTESGGYKPFQTGIMADINELKQLCEVVLARTVNTMLDKPGFRAALAAS